MERVALYMRVSTEEQAKHGLSLREQETALERYAKEHRMKVIGKYTDAGISARKRYTKRPELLRLLSDAQQGKIDTILFVKLDRWFRNVGDYYEAQKILDDCNVKWRATQEDYETVTASGRFKVNIMLSVAQDEADRTSERIKFVFDGKKERGEFIGGSVPYGYKIEEGKVVLDQEKAPAVKKLFDVYLGTGSVYKAMKEFPDITYNHALRIIKNQAYTGRFRGIEIPRIISDEEYEKAISHHTVRKTKNNRVYLFSGIMTCPICGCRLGGQTHIKQGREYTYYICCRARNYDCQNKTCYREDAIEEYLLTHIDGKIHQMIKVKPKAKSYQAERDAVKNKLSKLSDLYINDLISMEDYKKRYNDLQAQLASIPPDEHPVNVNELQGIFFENWQDVYNDLPREGKQEFWHSILKSVSFNGREVIDFEFCSH